VNGLLPVLAYFMAYLGKIWRHCVILGVFKIDLAKASVKDEAYLFYIRTQCLPRCKHSPPVIKTSLLMFYKVKVVFCSEIRTKHINAMWAPRRIF
jgi:hypothetical protein